MDDHHHPDWKQHAACRGTNPELFYPVAKDTPDIPRAKAVCARCPVRIDCLEHALNAGEDFGIWGGLTEAERRRVTRGRTRLTT